MIFLISLWKFYNFCKISLLAILLMTVVKSRCSYIYVYTGYTQKTSAVSEINKKFISHLTRAKRTPSAAATVQVSHAQFASHAYCGASFQDGVAAGKGFLCAPF